MAKVKKALKKVTGAKVKGSQVHITRLKLQNQQIDELNKLIKLKEREVSKIMNEIIRLKNKMSGLLHKQLGEKDKE